MLNIILNSIQAHINTVGFKKSSENDSILILEIKLNITIFFTRYSDASKKYNVWNIPMNFRSIWFGRFTLMTVRTQADMKSTSLSETSRSNLDQIHLI